MKTTISKKPTASRQDRLLRELIHDPYKTKGKLPEPTVCPICKAVFRDGRWEWAESWPESARQEICQACHRTKDDYAAGIVTLSGGGGAVLNEGEPGVGWYSVEIKE